jgi:transcriptional regulator with XRE-family HTH domain
MNNFSEWLSKEIKLRGWEQADLARAAKIDPGNLNRIINHNQKPGIDYCVKIAKALDYSAEDILRMVGWLPRESDPRNIWIRRLLEFSDVLPEAEWEELFYIAQGKKDRIVRRGEV